MTHTTYTGPTQKVPLRMGSELASHVKAWAARVALTASAAAVTLTARALAKWPEANLDQNDLWAISGPVQTINPPISLVEAVDIWAARHGLTRAGAFAALIQLGLEAEPAADI